jgi:hypothetical protein
MGESSKKVFERVSIPIKDSEISEASSIPRNNFKVKLSAEDEHKLYLMNRKMNM